MQVAQHTLTFPLPPQMTPEGIEHLREDLLALSCEPQGVVTLDGSAVVQISTAALQVILAFERSLTARGATLRLEQPTEMLQQGLTDLGIGRLVPPREI